MFEQLGTQPWRLLPSTPNWWSNDLLQGIIDLDTLVRYLSNVSRLIIPLRRTVEFPYTKRLGVRELLLSRFFERRKRLWRDFAGNGRRASNSGRCQKSLAEQYLGKSNLRKRVGGRYWCDSESRDLQARISHGGSFACGRPNLLERRRWRCGGAGFDGYSTLGGALNASWCVRKDPTC